MRTLIPTFLRRPTGRGELVADGARALVLISVVVAGFGWGVVQVGIFMLAVLGALVPRALGVRPAVDIATSVVLLMAAWSNVFDLYTEVYAWDKVIHAVLTGLLTTLGIVAAQRASILPAVEGHRVGLAIAAVALGLGLGSLWEMLEWLGNAMTDAVIFVSYDDSIGDLAADGLGALIAGIALPFLTGRSAVVVSAERPAGAGSRSSASR